MLLRARVIVPVAAPKIADGGLWVQGGCVRTIGPWAEVKALAGNDEFVDLGDVAVFPGLINAHAHLEYSSMAGLLRGDAGFTAWVRSVNATKGQRPVTDADWLAGADMLLRSGTTTVADMQTVVPGMARRMQQTPLRVVPFIEMTGVISRRAPDELLAEAESILQEMNVPGGYAPHAPYSTLPATQVASAIEAEKKRRLLSMHVAESAEEWVMFWEGKGVLHEMISSLGRPMEDCGNTTPLQSIARHGILQQRTLLAHANYLAPEDISSLVKSGASVVHCPSSHAFFQHQPFAFSALAQVGVNICLGTDSLATQGAGASLDMRQEMRRFAQIYPEASPETILRLATVNGAKALNLPTVTGTLSPQSAADLFAIPYTGKLEAAEACLFETQTSVITCYVAGRKVF